MAYGLKYQSDFTNTPPYYTAVSVKIYKDGYSGDVIDVRTSEVNITYNYDNDETPIIGKGAKVVIIANSDDMSYLEDLLLSYEKQFMCTIEYDGTIVFRGFTICDINERQLLPYAEVTVEFTDYLHRSEGKYPTLLQPIGGTTNLLSLINALLTETGLEFPLLVNSTLFEDSMSMTAVDTFIPQVLLQNSIFYSDSYSYDNIYEAINKALKSFNAFLYSYNDQWIIERQEDITRIGDWVAYDDADLDSEYSGEVPEGEVTASQQQSINKQNGDFEYTEMTQVAEYNSGLHTLILNLMDKKLDTLVFNDWPSPDSIMTNPYFVPEAGTIEYRTWYIHPDFTNVEVGKDMHDIADYIHYTTSPTFVKSLSYEFAVYFNTKEDVNTVLNISYSNGTDRDMSDAYWVGMYYFLRLDGGPYSNYFVTLSGPISATDKQGLGGPKQINLIGPLSIFYAQTAGYCYNYQITHLDGGNEAKKWDLNMDFDFTNTPVRIYNNGTTYIQYNEGLYNLLSQPEYQKLIISFACPQFSIQPVETTIWSYPHLFDEVYLGDISIGINAEEIENKITYVLNENFVKTEEMDLYLFDLANLNYANALLELDGFTRTNLWTSENSSTPIPLYEIFAKCKFRKYGRTIHNLKATIKTNEILKPFCIITDDTILNNSSEIITFLLNGYSWDLVNATYDINAEEYTEEEVIVDGVTYDSDGLPEGQDEPPTLYSTIWSVARGRTRSPIYIQWTQVAGGITGYVLQRKPYYSFVLSSWVNSFKQIFMGNETTFVDDIAREGPLPVGTTITYRVAAMNSEGAGPWSSEAPIIY